MTALIDFQIDYSQIDRSLVRVKKNMLLAARQGLDVQSKAAERALEAVVGAATGKRLGNSFTRKLYPLSGLANAPSATIYPKGGARTQGAVQAFGFGASIRPGKGRYLPVPTDEARAFARTNKRLSPIEFERATGLKLRSVYSRARGVVLLVVDNVRQTSSGNFRSNVRRRKDGSSYSNLKGAQTVVVFILVPIVRIDKRYDIASTVRPFGARIANEIKDKFRLLNMQSGGAQ